MTWSVACVTAMTDADAGMGHTLARLRPTASQARRRALPA